MAYQTWFAKRHRSLGWTIGLSFLFALPALSGLIGRLAKGREAHFGSDFEAVACAAERSDQGLSLYPPVADFACEGMQAAGYLYLPWIAEAFAGLTDHIPLETLMTVYPALFLLATACLILVPILRPGLKGDLAGTALERMPFISFASGSMFYWGNIASLSLGLIALTVRRPAFLILAILLAGFIKITYLSFLVFILFLDRSLYQRAGLFLISLLIGLIPTALFLSSASPEVAAWQAKIAEFGAMVAPGISYLGWLDMLGLDGRAPVFLGLFLVFAICLVAAGFGLAERWLPTGKDGQLARIWLGLAIGTFVNPRLMVYDIFLIAPGMILLIYAAASVQRRYFGQALEKLLAWMIFGALGLIIVMNVLDLNNYAAQVATFILSVAILLAGLPEVWPALKARPEFKRLLGARA